MLQLLELLEQLALAQESLSLQVLLVRQLLALEQQVLAQLALLLLEQASSQQ